MKYPALVVCKDSGLPFESCGCLRCQEDRQLRENTKNGGYVLDEADVKEVF